MKVSLLFFFLLLTSLSAQTYEEYLQLQEEAFSSYKDARDKAFSSFLNKEWKAYQESQGVSAYEEEKPKIIPVAKKRKLPQVKVKVSVRIKATEVKAPKAFKKIIITPESSRYKKLYMTYFGVNLCLPYDVSILFKLKGQISKQNIKKSWDSLAKSEYETLLKELNTVSAQLKLNDWGKYLLVKSVASNLYHHTNEAHIFTWFMLLKMDYDAHIAFQKHRVVLLLPVDNEMYNTVYYTLGNRKYYAIDYYAKGKLGSIISYDNIYEGANKGLGFTVKEVPLFALEPVTKAFTFQVDKKSVTINLEYNENLLHFFQSYPQVGYESYFSAVDSALLNRSIKASFIPLLKRKSQSEALDILLNFVQNAFNYKVDKEQFNVEKVMFASETLFYPYSDCEDRAILFSYLVKVLLDRDIVGLKYSDHMATAVDIDEKLQGEYVQVNKRAYIVADPTYVNASLGVSMPKYKGRKPYLIDSTGGEK